MEDKSALPGSNSETLYKELPVEYKAFGKNKFAFLHANFGTSDLEEIVTAFNVNSLLIVIPGDMLALDEATYAYNPSQQVLLYWKNFGWEIPKIYCVRKPHPNCLWNDILATILEKSGLPYALVQVPFYHQPKKENHEVVKVATDLLKTHYPQGEFTLVMDARFDDSKTRDLLDKIKDFMHFLIGCNSTRHGSMSDVLSSNTSWNHWCGALSKTGILYTLLVSRNDKNEKTYHFVSTVFTSQISSLKDFQVPKE